MDAVPPQGQNPPGTEAAFVCGHDIHTTVGVGVALVLARLRERLAGRFMFLFQPAEETLAGAAAMLADGAFATIRPDEIHALHCGPFPVGRFGVMPGFGMPGLDRGTVTLSGPDAAARAQRLAAEIAALSTTTRPVTSGDLERFVAYLLAPNNPLARFVVVQQAQATEATVRVTYRCWPEERYIEIRETIQRLASATGDATVSFPADPFPAVVTPEPAGRELQRFLGRRARVMHASIPFNGEDFSLFLRQMPGTYSFLGVRSPGAPIETSAPHYSAFNPDERSIGYGVRAMAGWLADRAAQAGWLAEQAGWLAGRAA